MTYEAALSAIHAKGSGLKSGATVDLSRIRRLLSALGNPQKKLRCIHIAGTNGKGSTAVFCAGILSAAGYKTGLFVSPYITDFCERIQIDGQNIPHERLAELCACVLAEGLECTEFELICAIAFLYYAGENCDVVVLETGLGGRLDPTNACEPPLVSVVTAIGFDHCAVLGDTLEKIALEKCGIIKNPVTVTAPHQPAQVLPVLTDCAENLFTPDLTRLSVQKSDLSGSDFTYCGQPFHIALCGVHQIDNALTAIEAVRHSGLNVPPEAVRQGLGAARNPARLEVFCTAPPVLADGAHNPAAARVLTEFLAQQHLVPNVVVGMMRDKAAEVFLRILLPHCKRVYCVAGDDTPRAESPERLCEIARQYNETAAAFSDRAQAISAALAQKEPLLVTGSLHLCALVRPLLAELTENDNGI